MDLHVTFKGLCLFVPDPKNKRLHVLMPGTGHQGGGNHVAQHNVTLEYAGNPKTLDMNGWFMDLAALPGNGNTLAPGDYAIDVGALVKRKIDAEQVGPKPRTSVVARFTLPAVDSFTPGDVAEWHIEATDGTTVRDVTLTNVVTCVVKNVNLEKFVWSRAWLRSQSTVETLPAPTPTGNKIVLTVKHLPPPANDPDLQVGEEAKHFRSYFSIFKGGASGPKLKLKKLPPNTGVLKDKAGATPFNCMVAQAPLEP